MGNIYLRFGADAKQAETEKARLFVIDNSNVWIPKSITANCVEEKESEHGHSFVLTLPDWFVKKNNLEDHFDPEWIAMGCPD